MSDAALTPIQSRILRFLARRDSWTTRQEMYESVGTTKGYSAALGAPTGQMHPNYLEALGLVERRGTSRFSYRITENGRRLVELERDTPEGERDSDALGTYDGAAAGTRLPIKHAYAFAAENGLADEIAKIRDMEIEWDRSYTTSVRRGRVIREFERRGLLEKFIEQLWPIGTTAAGLAERRRCLRIAEEYDDYLTGGQLGCPNNEEVEAEAVANLEFALEAHLRDFLAKNLSQIEPGLKLHQGDGGSGVEFPVDGGRIDLLTVDRSGKYVVIELKLSRGRNNALGQLLYYMGWVDKHLGNGPCRGVIIANDISDELAVAVARTPGVSLSRYRMTFAVEAVAPA